MSRRHGGALAGFVIAPLAAPLVLGVLLLGYRAVSGGELGILLRPLAALTMLEWLVVVGAPIAYTATVAVGVPAYIILIRSGPLRVHHVLAVGILTGAATLLFLFYEAGDLLMLAAVGGLMGAGSALVFWLLARRDDGPQPTVCPVGPTGLACDGVARHLPTMPEQSRFGAVLVWASRRGSALQAAAVLGAAGVGVARLLGRLSNDATVEAAAAMVLVWVIGTWLARH